MAFVIALTRPAVRRAQLVAGLAVLSFKRPTPI